MLRRPLHFCLVPIDLVGFYGLVGGNACDRNRIRHQGRTWRVGRVSAARTAFEKDSKDQARYCGGALKLSPFQFPDTQIIAAAFTLNS